MCHLVCILCRKKKREEAESAAVYSTAAGLDEDTPGPFFDKGDAPCSYATPADYSCINMAALDDHKAKQVPLYQEDSEYTDIGYRPPRSGRIHSDSDKECMGSDNNAYDGSSGNPDINKGNPNKMPGIPINGVSGKMETVRANEEGVTIVENEIYDS